MTTIEREQEQERERERERERGRGREQPASGVPAYDRDLIRALESGWQRRWQEQGLYRGREVGGMPKYYCLDFFPYPSGDGLSVGHFKNYVPTDTLSRYLRMRGHNVLHPMGWDAFGEPTEQFAINTGISPRAATDRNKANYKRQFDLVGISFDWDREIDSSLPEYYRWTQWFFQLLYRKGLAYRDTQWQWWCPTCQTTLSNQEAQDGVCWRGHGGLTKKQIPAWYFRITAYADQLLDGLRDIEWPEPIKLMQTNWIGRSEGTEIRFTTAPREEAGAGAGEGTAGQALPVFTTRPDTVFGVTFMVVAPEHPLVDSLVTADRRDEVAAYVERAKGTSEIDRLSTEREKTGVFTGSYAVNPLNGERVQLWVADYVLGSYGTGVVMGVPGHDTRDFAFARKYGIPVKVVIAPPRWRDGQALPDAYVGPGEMVNSGRFDGAFTAGDWKKLTPLERQEVARVWGLDVAATDARVAATTADGIAAVSDWVEQEGLGRRTVNYRMRDWLISRQRYWGAPIPIVYCPQHGEQPVPESDLPVVLPEMTDFAPDGSGHSPLARATEWVQTTCPVCGGPAERETDTMGGFACSSWYFLRFTSPEYAAGPFDPERMRYWMPVDQYVGGAEHAVLHLLYARFWTRVMYDAGLVPFQEPFQRLRNQGMLVVPTPHRRASQESATEEWVPVTPQEAERLPPDEITMRATKMSKSLRNVITPDETVARFGADALRLYELFMAPFDQEVAWDENGINGTYRFLGRVWELVLRTREEAAGERYDGADEALTRLRHKTVERVTNDLERFRFNTMIAALMEFANALGERYREGRWKSAAFQESVETLVRLLAPAAPFAAEGLWQATGGFGRAAPLPLVAGPPEAPFAPPGSVHAQQWPTWDPALTRDAVVTVVVQVNGRVRDRLELPVEATEEDVRREALSRPRIRELVADPDGAKYIYVKGRLLNIVLGR
ncbi:MAG TPA: leucine--tRNA ligase [Chloroflexota bacterium]|nr:leucine--tRNA ligase [Chloroflexota bacterium]